MLLLTLLILNLQTATMTLFDFTPESDISNWVTVDDTVMGGRSDGHFRINDEGHGEYGGHVSLENNGGFSSLRYRMPTIRIEGLTKVVLRLKGDGKRYQFREEIELDLKAMKPKFRGRALNMDDYPAEMLSEVAILIGNKKEQDFLLEIDWVRLK